MIRLATPEDIPHLVDLGARHHALAGAGAGYDRASAADLAARVIAAPEGFCAVSEGGSIGGALSPQMFNAGHLIATELWWNAFDGEGAALRDAFEAWARENGARETQIAALEAYRPAAVGRALRGRGYSPFQTLYVKEIG